MLAWTKKENNLRFLSFIIKPRPRFGRPTWAVDWSLFSLISIRESEAIRWRSIAQNRLFDACLGFDPLWYLQSPGVVTANGFLCDTITIAPMCVPDETFKEWDEWLASGLEFAIASGLAYGSHERVYQALLRTFMRGHDI